MKRCQQPSLSLLKPYASPTLTHTLLLLLSLPRQVLDEYDDMVEQGVVPDTLTLNCIVEAKAHSQGTVAAREALKLLLSQHANLKPSAQTYVALMRPCEHDGDTKTSFEIYQEALAAEDMPLHVDLFNTLISVCTRAQDFAAAENIFDEMREKGVKPKSATYLKYIYACFRLQQPDRAYQMLCVMEKDWRVPESKDYAKMLSFFNYARHPEGKTLCLKGLLQDMPADAMGGGAGAEHPHKQVVHGLFRQAQNNQDPEETVRLAETLKAANIGLDRFQQVGMIFARMQLNQPVPAFSQLIELYEGGHSLPERAYDQMAEELAKQASTVDEAYFLLESLKGESRPVPLPAVNIIIEACALMEDLDRAFATWAELEQLDLKPDAGTFNALLNTCVRTRELASGRRLLSRMAQDGVAMDSTTFMHRTSIHVMAREPDLALKTLDDCREAGIKPHPRMFAALISLCCRMHNHERAAELLEEMEGDGHRISVSLRSRVNSLGDGRNQPRDRRMYGDDSREM